MKKDNEKGGIVFDRDTSEPEAKLVKRKKKTPQPEPESKAIAGCGKDAKQPSTVAEIEAVINKNANSPLTGKAKEGESNRPLNADKDSNRKKEDQKDKQRENEDNAKKDIKSKDATIQSREDDFASNLNQGGKDALQLIASKPADKEDNKKELSDKENNANDNIGDPNEGKSDRNQYKNNQKSNSLNAFNSLNNYEDTNKVSNSDQVGNKRGSIKADSDKREEEKNIERLQKEEEMNREIAELKSKVGELLLTKEEFERHKCPTFSFDREAYLMQIESLKSELERKDKTIQTLTQTNKRQRKALESLSDQVNEKLGKVNFNMIPKGPPQSQNRSVGEENIANNKYQSLESSLKLKEKELKNAVSLIEILSKDNLQLKTSLDTYGEYHKKLQLLDLSKSKDAEIFSLTNELNLVKKQVEEHKQCYKSKSEIQANVAMLKEEIRRNKKEISALRKKNAELLVGSQSHSSHQHLPHLPNQDKEQKKEYKSCNDFNSSNQSIKKKSRTTSMSPISKPKPNDMTLKDKPGLKNDNFFHELFTDEEKRRIMQLFGDNEKYELFIKKVIVLETARMSQENKYKFIVKQLMDKLSSLDEQIEYLNQKNKESESRLKIFQCQVNEFKQGKKVYQKKIAEYQSTIQSLDVRIKELKEQNTLITQKFEEAKSHKIIFKEDTAAEETIEKHLQDSIEADEDEPARDINCLKHNK